MLIDLIFFKCKILYDTVYIQRDQSLFRLNKNSIGPRTETCGTPNFSYKAVKSTGFEQLLILRYTPTYFSLFLKKGKTTIISTLF